MFKLIVCANDLPEIKSNDEGTWRRIRVCPFKALFCEDPAASGKPFCFLVDKNLNEKFKKWRTVLFAMLVERAKLRRGTVNDCKIVMEASDDYRSQQDVFSEFLKAKVVRDKTNEVKQSVLKDAFTSWWMESRGRKENAPNFKELTAYMERHQYVKKLGSTILNLEPAWANIRLVDYSAPGAGAVTGPEGAGAAAGAAGAAGAAAGAATGGAAGAAEAGEPAMTND
jgi:hypothetical protein